MKRLHTVGSFTPRLGRLAAIHNELVCRASDSATHSGADMWGTNAQLFAAHVWPTRLAAHDAVLFTVGKRRASGIIFVFRLSEQNIV